MAAILPALIPDIEAIYDVYFKAFQTDRMGSLMLDILFPSGVNEEFRKAHTVATAQYWHHSSNQYTYKAVDIATGDIVGMALGDVYMKERSEEERKNPGVEWLQGEQRERAETILNPLWEVREKLFGGRRYIYVHVIAVDPAYQGRKAGALLVNWGIELGENAMLPVYGEASPTTAALYRKMGFETLEEKIVHKKETLGTESDIVVPLMVKMPSSCGLTFAEWREKGYPELTRK
ncbi:hypothetical protein V2G26_017555 [Clonostachys chloroleuca]